MKAKQMTQEELTLMIKKGNIQQVEAQLILDSQIKNANAELLIVCGSHTCSYP